MVKPHLCVGLIKYECEIRLVKVFFTSVFLGPPSTCPAAFSAHSQTAQLSPDPDFTRAFKQMQSLSTTEELITRARSQRKKN